MTELNDLKGFNFENANVTLWLFKKSKGKNNEDVFTGRWIETSEELDATLINICIQKKAYIEETIEYGLLAENNSNSALTLPTIETHSDQIVTKTADAMETFKIKKLSEIKNSDFYVIKIFANGSTLYGVSKIGMAWDTKKLTGMSNLFFTDDVLNILNTETFRISDRIDFFILGETIFVTHKANFESALSFKAPHIEQLATLVEEKEFLDIFDGIENILSYVGENKIQLRRICAIKEKGHYKNPKFMDNLKARYKSYKLDLTFSADGKLVATQANCRDIFQALLDHRLQSGFSEQIYDVQDASKPI